MKDSTALSQKAHTTTSFYHLADPSSEGASWYLVDQAKYPDVLRLLFEHDPVPIYDLPYIYSEYREQAFDGPLIIRPATAQSEEWLHRWMTEGKALALHGQALTLEEIREHFVSLNTVRTPNGDSLFCYADSATFGAPNEQGLVEGAGLLITQGFTRVLSDDELATIRKTRQGAYWSDTLKALATLTHSQDGT